MSKFDNLIGLLDKLNKDEFGSWHIDRVHKGTIDDPKQFAFPVYTKAVNEFIQEVYDFSEKNPDYERKRYLELIEERGLKNIESTDIDSLDAQGTMALLMWAVRGERFCDGLIFENLKEGRIQALLEHLKKLTQE